MPKSPEPSKASNEQGLSRRNALGAFASIGSGATAIVGSRPLPQASSADLGAALAAGSDFGAQDRPGVWRKWSSSSRPLEPEHEGYSWFTDARNARWFYVPDGGVVRAESVGVKADGVADDWFALMVAEGLLPDNGGVLSLPSGTIRISRPLAITKRQTRVVGRSYHETYLRLSGTASSAVSPWLPGANNKVGEIRTVHESGHANTVPYRCVETHTGGRFQNDWAAGKWEQWCAISIRASDCSVELCNIGVPAHGLGISVQGAARFNLRNTMLVPEQNLSGTGLLLDDRDNLGRFSPGSYTHTIGPGNGFASLSQGQAQLRKGIASAGTGGGINATRILFNHFVGDLCAHIQTGGGNSYIGNLMQSATGGNSGTRPYTGGTGTGVKFGGETHFASNYFERFALDVEPTSSSARYTVSGHSSDASNDIFPVTGSFGAPGFAVSGDGLDAEVIDGLAFVVQHLTNDGEAIIPKLRGVTVSGNGQARLAITISGSGCRVGQMLLLHANSWPFQIIDGGTVDLGSRTPAITMGQANATLVLQRSECSFAEFIFTPSRSWRLLWTDNHKPRSARIPIARDHSSIATSARHIDLSGQGSSRIGVVLEDGHHPGERVLLTATGGNASFAETAARWGVGGVPVLGVISGQALCVELLWLGNEWIEVGRSINP
jgi:hypothetical protein